MTKYFFTYHGGKKPENQEEGQKLMQEWREWVSSMDASLINPGSPLGVTKILTKEGLSESASINPISGFSILEAENIDQAINMLKSCPHLKNDGSIEISEIMEMPNK